MVLAIPFWANASEVSLEWKNPQELIDCAELRSMHINAFLAAYRISSIPTDKTAFLENYFDSSVKPQMQKAQIALFAKVDQRIVGMLLFEQTGSSVYTQRVSKKRNWETDDGNVFRYEKSLADYGIEKHRSSAILSLSWFHSFFCHARGVRSFSLLWA